MTGDAHHPTAQVSSARAQFLQFAHQDLQAVIRQLDTKAGLFITLLVFLITGGFPIVKDVCAKLKWTGPDMLMSWAYVASFLATILAFVATAFAVHHVIRPRGSEFRGMMRGIIFYADVLDHSGPEHYHDTAKKVSDEALLKSLSSGIYSLSKIVDMKTRALRLAKWPTLAAFALWAINSALGILILTKQ